MIPEMNLLLTLLCNAEVSSLKKTLQKWTKYLLYKQVCNIKQHIELFFFFFFVFILFLFFFMTKSQWK